MAVKELGVVYGSQVVNEAVDKITEKYPQGISGAKYVDLGLGALGALTAMDMVPVRGDVATAVTIIGLGRLAKATMDIINTMSPTAGMAVRPMAVTPSVRVTGAPSTTGFGPAGV